MDDFTLGGPEAVVAADVKEIKSQGTSKGLFLNEKKCEAISTAGQVTDSTLQQFIQLIPSTATLLGAPLTTGSAMDSCLAKRCEDLKRATLRLEQLCAHDALLLLRVAFSAPLLQHTLRAAPCDNHATLPTFDNLLRSALSNLCNVFLTDDQWIQASLPARSGGLGIRRVTSLAMPAFLASSVGTRQLQDQILQANAHTPDNASDSCVQLWLDANSGSHVPEHPAKQKSWDESIIRREFDELLHKQVDDYDKARLLAASAKHSADWLYALPISSCGLRLDDEAIRIATGLRLGADICQPHSCTCGALVDARGAHAMSCKRGSGKITRHNYINDIVQRSLARAGIPATKEPLGLLRSDGKRPDGLTLLPWREGRCLVWDVTVADTTAASYLSSSSALAGSAAETAAARKVSKYVELSPRYEFIPIAMETHGSLSRSALSFFADLGRRITATTSDSRETSFLYQRLSVALQRFNAVCVQNTFGSLYDDDV
jgi:hypothetical protein